MSDSKRKGKKMNAKLQDEWMAVSDQGEMVASIGANSVMSFTTDSREARKTTSSEQAAEWCRIAKVVYNRNLYIRIA